MRVLEDFERLGSVEDIDSRQDLLHGIEENRSDPSELYSNGELVEAIP